MQWLRDMLRRPSRPDPDDVAQDMRVADLRSRAHATVKAADRTLREAKALDNAMREAEQTVRRQG